jgi:hypothetical protein
MHRPIRFLSVAPLLLVCLLLSNCPFGGGNVNNANTNANANVPVANSNTPEVQNRAPTPTPSPTPVGTFEGKFCNEQSLGRFPTNAFRSARSSDTSCVTVRTQSGTGGSTVVFFHCRNNSANCTADITVKYDDGRPDEGYRINCTP